MRKPAPIIASLVLLGLVPIGVWVWLASAFVSALHAEGRKTGQAAAIMLIIAFSFIPALIGGIMMVAGGGLLVRKPRTARIMASIGTGIVLVWGVGALYFILRAEAPPAVWAGAIAYLLALCGLIAWLWRSHSAPS